MKKLNLILCTVLAALMLFSCAGTGAPSSSDTAEDTQGGSSSDNGSETGHVDRLADARAAADGALSSVQTGDFEGMSFIITCTSEAKTFGDFDVTTTFSQELYTRMETVGERLNLSIVSAENSIDEIVQGLKDEKNSGILYTHLLMVDAKDVGTLQYPKLIGSMSSLPFVDLTKPYYDAEFCEYMNTPGGLYALWGDACRDYDSMMCVFYNDALRASLEIEEPDSLVHSGGWTYDKMAELAKLAAASSTEERALYGVLNADSDKFFRSAFVASGMNSVKLSDGKLSLNDNTALGDSLSESIKKIIDSGAYTAGDASGRSSEQVFFDGEGLFLISTLGATKQIYNMDDVWGLLPLPTIEAGGSYSTPMTKKTSVVCYPSSAADLNEIGIFIENFFAASYKLIDAAYYDTYFHSYVRNQDTYDMLKLLLGDVGCDFALCYTDEFTNYSKGTFDAFVSACWGNRSYSTLFKNGKTAANRSLAYVK